MKTDRLLAGKTGILFLFAFFVGTLISCSVSRNWKGSDVTGHNQASFSEFSGTQKFQMMLKTGEDCVIDYRVKQEKGTLRIKIYAPGVTLVDKKITTEESDQIRLKNNNVGKYFLVISGNKSAGSFDIKYGPALKNN